MPIYHEKFYELYNKIRTVYFQIDDFFKEFTIPWWIIILFCVSIMTIIFVYINKYIMPFSQYIKTYIKRDYVIQLDSDEEIKRKIKWKRERNLKGADDINNDTMGNLWTWFICLFVFVTIINVYDYFYNKYFYSILGDLGRIIHICAVIGLIITVIGTFCYLINIVRKKFLISNNTKIINISPKSRRARTKELLCFLATFIISLIIFSRLFYPTGTAHVKWNAPVSTGASFAYGGFLFLFENIGVSNDISDFTYYFSNIFAIGLIIGYINIFFKLLRYIFTDFIRLFINAPSVKVTYGLNIPVTYLILNLLNYAYIYIMGAILGVSANQIVLKINTTTIFLMILSVIWIISIAILEFNDKNYETSLSRSFTEIKGDNIEDRAFNKDFYLDSIEIPDSVVSIGKYAFNECKALKTLNIPNSVSMIGENAFSKCSALETVNLGNNVTDIGVKAFEDCVNLKQINIPDSVVNIGYGAFKGCTNIQGHICLSDKITVIHNELFGGCNKLEKITIGHSTSRIEEKAFIGCEMLKEINIPDSVTSIYDYAFKDCKSLTALYLPDSLKHIGVAAFQECKSLIGIMLPSGLDKISESMFYGCTGLMAVNIPDSITRIGKNAFSKCSSLSNIEIPDSVSNIGYEAFSECSNLNDVIIPDSVVSIGVLAFYKCNSIVNINIPNSVNKLGVKAFAECAHLKNVKIGKAISVIDKAIFDKCEELEEVTISKNVLNIEAYAFGGCRSLKNIYFEGEKWKWCSIEKAPTWDKDTGNYTVHCTDGDIKK